MAFRISNLQFMQGGVSTEKRLLIPDRDFYRFQLLPHALQVPQFPRAQTLGGLVRRESRQKTSAEPKSAPGAPV